jgi:hypothetical protein
MPAPPRGLTSSRVQAAIAGLAAAALAIAGFQTGRYTVDAAAVAKNTAVIPSQPPSDVISRKNALAERQQDRIIIRDIATVPFSELYDVLKSAPREQLLAWARDLDRMPRGPRQRAAVAAYYKSLIQVDPRAAIEAVSQAANLDMRDVAIDALLKTTPESSWGDVAEMLESLPYQGRGSLHEDVIWNWSRVDPEAVSKFIERHPEKSEADSRLSSLLSHWARIDPASAQAWLEADASRQTTDAWRAFVGNWAQVDRAAAMNYAVANARRPNFDKAIDDLAYELVRTSKEDATRLMLLLPSEQAQAAMRAIARTTHGVLLGVSEDFQRPPEEVAPWMVTLPVELWREGIGPVAEMWLQHDVAAATAWLDQLRPDLRDVAIVSFCRIANWESAAQVITLGFTISDPRVRDKALEEFARSQGSTKEKALDVINDLSIGDEQKDYLRNLIAEDANDQ